MSERLRLRAAHEALGARWMDTQGWEVPASYSDPRAEWEHVRLRAGLLDLGYAGLLRITGRDRRRWLHGMVTNDVLGLADGKGVYAAFLNVQGHMLADLRIYAVEDALLLELPPGTQDKVAETLDRYLMMDRVEIQGVAGELSILSLQGPGAAAIVAGYGVEPGTLPPLGIRAVASEDGPTWVARVERAGEPGFDLWVPVDRLAATWDRLLGQVRAAGGGPVGWETLNTLRVEAGIPWWGAELTEAIVPFEARLEAAISLTKGCYIGQEIIARIVARGQVNNLMVGLALSAAAPPPPVTPIAVAGKVVGRTATAVRSPTLEETIALAFIRREHAAPGTPVSLQTGGTELAAQVVELPFIQRPKALGVRP